MVVTGRLLILLQQCTRLSLLAIQRQWSTHLQLMGRQTTPSFMWVSTQLF